MANLGSLIIIFALISEIITLLIRVIIVAAILVWISKKFKFEKTNYKTALVVVLIPTIIIGIIAWILSLIGLKSPISLLVTIPLTIILYIPIIKKAYNTTIGKAFLASISIFAIGLGIVLILLGVTFGLGNIADPLKSNVPQGVCTYDCKFSYSISDGTNPLTVTGYNIPFGKYQERENYILVEKTFSVNELENMKSGIIDVNGDEKVIGKLDASGCNFVIFTEENRGSSGVSCEKSSSNPLSYIKMVFQ